MIIDMHVHIFPEAIAQRAVETLASKCKETPYHYGRESQLLELMADAGVDLSVVQCIATNPAQTRKVNDYAIRVAEHPRLIPFGSIHPEFPLWKQELHRLKAAGVTGIKLHPDYQNFFIDEERMLPIYREIISLEMTLLFHAGVDIGMPEPVHCTPERISHVLEEFEGYPVVFAHMGGYDMWDSVERYLAGKRIYLDTSYAIDKMDPEQAARLIEKHGSDRILFGSDSPWGLQSQQISYLNGMPLSQTQKENIFWKNARSLLLDK